MHASLLKNTQKQQQNQKKYVQTCTQKEFLKQQAPWPQVLFFYFIFKFDPPNSHENFIQSEIKIFLFLMHVVGQLNNEI